MRWTTRLIRIQAVPAGTGVSYGHTFVTQRPSRLGTLPLGYADGLDRGLSNAGEVLIRGQPGAHGGSRLHGAVRH